MSFGLKTVCLTKVPSAVVSPHLRGTYEQAAELPVGANLLQNERRGVRTLRCRDIHNVDAICPWWQVRNHECRCVCCRPRSVENSTKKFCPCQWGVAFSFEHERRTRSGMRAGQI